MAYSVAVSGSGPTPTGSVLVSDGQGDSCAVPSLSSGSGFCFITENASGGPFTITATYFGDDNYSAAVTTLTETVTPALPVLYIAPSANPAPSGPVDYSVTVAVNGSDPTGSIVVSDGLNGSCSISTIDLGTGSCSIDEATSQDPYTVTAVYSGDANYLGASADILEIVN